MNTMCLFDRKVWVIITGVLILACSCFSALYRWYWQPYAWVNPKQWHTKVINYPAAERVTTLWLHRRHAGKLNLSDMYLLQADSKLILIRLTGISYPTAYSDAVRLEFELINSKDENVLASLQRVSFRKVQYP